MRITLDKAPVGQSLYIDRIVGADFADRMGRMGLYEKAWLMRLNESVAIGPVKVRCNGATAILSGWLAGQMVIHLDDDRRLPLPECSPGDRGHVEGIAGQKQVEASLFALGITEGDGIKCIRRIPPMTYRFRVNGRKERINEGFAAHILGSTAEGQTQFSSVGVGEVFAVQTILPGADAQPTLIAMGVAPGAELILTGVSVSHDLDLAPDHPIACVTRDGMRLYLREQDAAGIFVTTEDAG